MFIHRKSVIFAVLLGVGSASILKADQIYVEGYNDNFGLLDPQTGAYTLIGVTSERIGGMGFTSDGSLYGLGLDSVLYRINTTTGSLTKIGNTGLNLSPAAGMGATQDGTLYAFGQKNQMYTINTSNAKATFLGNTGFDSDCDPAGDAVGNLYNSQGVYGSGFYKIDRTTGLGTLLGSSNSGAPTALAYTDNTMYAINNTGSIYTVNLTSGASTLLSTYNVNAVGGPNGAYSATARISSVPEASHSRFARWQAYLLARDGYGVGISNPVSARFPVYNGVEREQWCFTDTRRCSHDSTSTSPYQRRGRPTW